MLSRLDFFSWNFSTAQTPLSYVLDRWKMEPFLHMRCFWPHETMTTLTCQGPTPYPVPFYLRSTRPTRSSHDKPSTPPHDTTDPLEISVRNISHQRRMNEVVNPLLDHDSRWRVPFFLHCPSKSSRQADMAKRMARDRMRWDRMCTASRQQRSLLALATAPGCSPGPSIGGVALCDWAAAGHQVMAVLTVPRDPAGVAKRMAHERRESLHSLWVDPLIFCNHGRVMGRFALHDWEPMVLNFWWGKYFFSFKDFSVSFLCRVLIKAMWCGVFSSAVVGCLVVLAMKIAARTLFVNEKNI